MKKVLFVFAVCLCFGLTAAHADSPAAELFAKRCSMCHGKDGSKTSGASGGVELKGQSAADIKAKLMGYKEGTYGGAKKRTMERMVKKFDDEQLAGLAEVIGGF